MRRWMAGLLAAALLATVGGCGQKKPVVFGLVTLDGQPLDNGNITFSPVAGDGQTSGALIGPDGGYRTDASPTKLKVVISASKVIGKRKMYETPDSPTVDILQEILPPRYSDMKKTELTVTIVPGENEKNFELTSDKGQRPGRP
jgi:hypothetical protein